MNNEFDWWLLIVGLVGGAGLVWLILSTGRRGSEPVEIDARREEADWIVGRLSEGGTPVDPETAERVLALHEEWETGGGEIDWQWEQAPEAPPSTAAPLDDDLPEDAARASAAEAARAATPRGDSGDGVTGDQNATGSGQVTRPGPTEPGEPRESVER